MDYKKAIEEIKLNRKNALLANEQRIISALRQNDKLRKLDIEIRQLEHEIRSQQSDPAASATAETAASLALAANHADAKNKNNEKDKDKDKDKRQTLHDLKNQRTQMLSDIGISENVPFSCERCGDTGIFNGKHCSCVISMTATAETPLYSFIDSDLSVFTPADRERAGKVYAAMLAFCQKFPDTNSKNLILVGKTGTGKTFLASCVASQLLQQGYSILFVSAFDFVNRMLKYHTAPMGEKLEHLLPLLDCDLLIIDDLGTENLLKNVTVEYFYNVLNERIRQSKHIMITTNLDQDGLAGRYGERIFSRLCDKRLSAWIVLAENDLRRN